VAEVPRSQLAESTIGDALTEAAHAECFAERYGSVLRFNHSRDSWLVYDRNIWRRDLDGHVYRLALEFVRSRQLEAVTISDRKTKEQTLKFAVRQESKAALDRLVGLAKNFKPFADVGDQWDVDPLLVGAPNGVIDLRSGRLCSGDPADRITMSLGVPYDPYAEAPRWYRFLSEIFCADQELITFVQRFMGYCLTGLTTEQALAVFYGRGANGKSTFLSAVGFIFGDYCHNLPFSAIELKQRASIPNDLAALDGKRFVTASETNDGTRLNEARVKALTGGDRISARFMHSEWFSFRPVAKFVLAVNHRPSVSDDSVGFWRRIRLVPFQQSFYGARCDDRLEQHLRSEGPGILRWAVEGCLAWQQGGLGTANAIRDATSTYQMDSDPLSEFLSDCCEQAVTAVTRAAELHEAYQKWADRQRLAKADRLNGKDFGQRMGERFKKVHRNTGKVYEGIRLVVGNLW
jgi:P4 family phage/plasmid primase-like protien